MKHDRSSADSPHVLILRLWREPRQDSDTPPQWRALIEDVGNGQRYPVRDLAALRALLASCGEVMVLDDFLADGVVEDEA